MPLPRLASTLQFAIRLIFCGSLAISCWGQDVPSAPTPQTSAAAQTERVGTLNYTKPVSHFPNPIAPYQSRHVPPPNLSNTGRIDQFLHDGKLYLSLKDAIALALENNLDIAIARYTLNIADTDILRQVGSRYPRHARRFGAQHTGRWRGGHRSTVGRGHRRHQPGSGRSRRRHQWIGQFDAWLWTADWQLRSDSYRHASGRPLQSSIKQFILCAVVDAKYRHG